MATQTAHPQRAKIPLWLFAVVGAATLSILPLTLFSRDTSGPATLPPVIDTGGARVAYLEFGTTRDTLWLASPVDPRARQQAGVIDHAPDFGAVAALSPDGGRLAYTALAPTMKPAPDAPAGLWLRDVAANVEAVQLASGVDLLVKPLWSRDGDALVYRRSVGSGTFSLYHYDIASRTERELLTSGVALFPIVYTPDGGSLYYVSVQTDASDLHRIDLATGESTTIVRLAETLTRDWTLSPDGDRLAYLEMTFAAGEVSSIGRIYTLGRDVQPAYTGSGNAFGPVWRSDGHLSIGHDAALNDDTGVLVHVTGGDGTDTPSQMPAPRRGFDVPLGWTADKYLAVRSFEGNSAADPGRATLDVVTEDGTRVTIANGEVTFLGWINP